MQLQTVTQAPIESDGIERSTAFKIKACAASFEALSSRLYTDKILAVIRETFCNAQDAHVKAGTVATPIEVHLPNTIEPWFSVKDFGTGLSDDAIHNLYSTYFDSTKSESNDCIGGFGVGSKAGLCYADSFTVVSRFNGEKGVYVALKDKGLPAVNTLDRNPTDEPNGMEISFAVKEGDIPAFISNAKRFFARVKTPVTFLGYDNFEAGSIVFIDGFEGADWKMRADGSAFPIIIMGCVPYPLRHDDTLQFATPAQRALMDCPLEIVMPIGSIGVAMSREALSLDKDSAALISVKLAEIEAHLLTKLQVDIDAVPNMWQAARAYKKLLATCPYAIKETIRNMKFTWRGKAISHTVRITDAALCSTGNPSGHLPKMPRITKYRKNYDRKKITSSFPNAVSPSDDNAIYVFCDVDKGIERRIQSWMRQGGSALAEIHVIHPTSDCVDNQSAAQALGMDGELFELLSVKFPKPPKASISMSDEGKANYLEFDETTDSSYAMPRDFWNVPADEIVPSEGGVYVEISNYGPLTGKAKDWCINLRNELNLLGVEEQIIGVKSRAMKHILKHSADWKTVDTFIREECAKKAINPATSAKMAAEAALQAIESDGNTRALVAWLTSGAIDEKDFHPDIVQFRNDYALTLAEASANTRRDSASLVAMFTKYGVSMPSATATTALKDKCLEFVKRWPLINLIVNVPTYMLTREVMNKTMPQYTLKG